MARGLVKRGAQGLTRRGLRRAAAAAGYTLVTKHWWGPVPDLDALPPGYFERRSPLSGLSFDVQEQLELVRTALGPFLAEFEPLTQGDGAQFNLDNGTFGPVDAEVLYAMTRWKRPRRIVELGSGASTLVLDLARRANEAGGHPCELTSYDPYPGTVAKLEPGRVAAATDLREMSLLELPLEFFAALEANDILFVDTSHAAKTGSDVNYLVLDVLPVLQPGVVVHFHDVFLPWEYPPDWLVNHGAYWTEQYLLQAFLAFNDAYRVLVSAQAMIREFPEETAALIPSSATEERARRFAEVPLRPPGPAEIFRSARGEQLPASRRPVVTPGSLWLVREAG